MICKCGGELEDAGGPWLYCPSCGAKYDPPLEVLPPLWIVSVLGLSVSSAILGLIEGKGLLTLILVGVGFSAFILIPTALFRAGINRRRRSRLR